MEFSTFMTDIAPWIQGVSPPAILGFVIWSIVTGRLVPRRTYDDIIHDRDEWRAAHRISESNRLKQETQITSLLEVGKTVDKIMSTIYQPPKEIERE